MIVTIIFLNKEYLMKVIKDNLLLKSKKNFFIKNVFRVAFGTALAQFVNILASPILTRMYSAEAMGILGVFTSFVAIFSQAAALTYPDAIVLPKEKEEALTLVKLSFLISVISSLSMLVIFIYFGESLIELLGMEDISSFILFVPLQVFFYNSVKIGQQWMLREKKFKIKARITVIDKIVVVSLQIILGVFFPAALTLILIYILGQGLFALMLISLSGLFYLANVSNLKAVSMKRVLLKYSDFPKYRAPQVIINAFSSSMPIFILSSFFGPAFAGFYTLTNKVLHLPTSLVGNSIGDVFFPRIAEANHKGENLFTLLLKPTLFLSLLGIIPFGLIFMFGPSLFPLIFGQDWVTAGHYARWMSVFTFTLFVSRPSIRILPIIRAQRAMLVFTIIKIIFTSIALISGSLIGNDITAIFFFSITDSILYISFIIYILYRTHKFNANSMKT